MRPGGKVSEVLAAGVFALATGNIMVYTVKSFKATYNRPPLALWQTGAGDANTKNSGSPNGESPAEEKKNGTKSNGGEGLLETLINPLGPNPLLDPLAPLKAAKGLAEKLFG